MHGIIAASPVLILYNHILIATNARRRMIIGLLHVPNIATTSRRASFRDTRDDDLCLESNPRTEDEALKSSPRAALLVLQEAQSTVLQMRTSRAGQCDLVETERAAAWTRAPVRPHPTFWTETMELTAAAEGRQVRGSVVVVDGEESSRRSSNCCPFALARRAR